MLYRGITLPGCPDPDNIRKLDILPIPQIRRMQRVGVAIDREWLWDLSARLEARKQELRKDIASFIPPDRLDEFVGASDDNIAINVDSAEQIARLLYDVLGVGWGKRLKKTKSGDRLSTGKKQLETLKRDHSVIPLILEYRECSKLKSTYTDKLPVIARLHRRGGCSQCGRVHRKDHHRVHTSILTTRTDTGRLASKNPNLQNIPARTKLGAEVRKAFIPECDEFALLSCDYSQIELRLMGHAAREPSMIRIFSTGGDIHLDTAMRAFGIADPKAVDKILHRAPCKNVNFGIVYGLGPPGLYDLMAVTYATAGMDLPDWLTVEWCEGFIDKWFGLYPECHAYLDLQHYRARRYGIVWDFFGRVRRVPEVRSVHERVQAAGLRQAGNMPIQGSAAGVFKIGAARVEERFELIRSQGVEVEALLPIHDELLIEVEREWADEVKEMAVECMAGALDREDTGECACRVPVKVDGKVMTNGRWEKE